MEKVPSWEMLKLRTSSHPFIKGMKRQPRSGKRQSQYVYSTKDLIPEYWYF